MTLTTEQLAALQAFKVRNGRSWKSKLLDAWMTGRDAHEPDGSYLRQVRNQVGPSGLLKLRVN
jgi:hypothetical protein